MSGEYVFVLRLEFKGMNMSHQTLVEFMNVQKTYDGTELVIKNLNLKIEKGEFLTLSGRQGRENNVSDDVSRI